jgi:beta-galactosidase
MKFGASLYPCDLKTRDSYARMDIAGYNYGILRYENDLKKYPNRIILGTETFCSDAYQFWEMAKRNPRLIGDFVWSGMDYLGEVGVGAWEYKDYAPDFSHGLGWVSAGSGRIDLTGKALTEMAYTRVAFELDKIRIGVKPVDNALKPHSPSAWKMTNAIESWSWNGLDGKMTEVEVYTRASKVALYINGKCVGKKKVKNDCRVTFRTRYYSGEIKAFAYGENGKITATASLKTAGDDTKLTLQPEQLQIKAKNDLCYVRLQYTDGQGIVKPLERGDITVTVQDGTLLALGNACPYHPSGYTTDVTDTYYGEAIAVIKPQGTGKMRIEARSKYGLSIAEVLVC